MDELADHLRAMAGSRAGTARFTLHLDFLATDHRQALAQADLYAQALNLVRPEVDCYTARLSPGGDWTAATAVFCGIPGPHDSDVCLDIAGHRGRHHGPGDSQSWTDDDVPQVPDTAEGIG